VYIENCASRWSWSWYRDNVVMQDFEDASETNRYVSSQRMGRIDLYSCNDLVPIECMV